MIPFDIKNIVFWDPSYSPHKVSFINALAINMKHVNITVCADQDISQERRELGWGVDVNSVVPWLINQDISTIEELVFRDPENTLHIFSGIRWVRSITAAIGFVKKYKARFAIMHEPRVREGWKGELRFLQSLVTEGWFRNNAEFILAIGKNGPIWFESVGYPKNKIFPFAYFVDPPTDKTSGNETAKTSELIHIGYVGRLVEMKGIYDIAQAVSLLGDKALLTIVGVGPDEIKFKALCTSLSIRVNFAGVIPIGDVNQIMAKFDVLVLASNTKDDGWGVVVSEALMTGTAVIATPEVGASLMLDESLFGICVPARRPELIAAAIMKLKSDGAYQPAQRESRSKLAKRRLSATAGAQYLAEIIAWSSKEESYPVPFHQYKLDVI